MNSYALVFLFLIWDKTINTTDILTVVSLIAIYLTLLELKKQRNYSAFTKIMVKSSNEIIVKQQKPFSEYENKSISIHNLTEKTINNLIIKFDFCYSKIEEILSNKGINVKFNIFQDRSGTLRLNDTKLFMLDNNTKFVDFIKPIDSINIELPNFLLESYALICLGLQNSDKIEHLNFIFSCEYHNIYGKKFKLFYTAVLTPYQIDFSEKNLIINLEVYEIKKKVYSILHNMYLETDKLTIK